MTLIKNSKKITKAPKLTAGAKKRIKKLLDQDFKPAEVAEAIGCTINQVNAVKYGRVKMNNKSRSDKGLKRESMQLDNLDINISDNDSTDEILLKSLNAALVDLNSRTMKPDEKIIIIEKASRLHKNIEDRKLYKYMKRPDAELIIRVMRRLDPDLSVEEIKKIYLEEYTILRNMKNKAEV